MRQRNCCKPAAAGLITQSREAEQRRRARARLGLQLRRPILADMSDTAALAWPNSACSWPQPRTREKRDSLLSLESRKQTEHNPQRPLVPTRRAFGGSYAPLLHSLLHGLLRVQQLDQSLAPPSARDQGGCMDWKLKVWGNAARSELARATSGLVCGQRSSHRWLVSRSAWVWE